MHLTPGGEGSGLMGVVWCGSVVQLPGCVHIESFVEFLLATM